MPEIVIYSRTSDAGEHFLNFSIDGKKFVAVHKKGKPGDPKAWLDEFEALLKFSKKYGLNPYATPLKSDPTKADKYKKRRMFDRVKYSWNDDESLKEGPRKGLKHFIDVVPKEKLDEHIVDKHSPEVEQMKLKLARYNLKRESYMKDSCDQKNKDSAWGLKPIEKYTPPRNNLRSQPTLEEMRSPVEEIINPHMKQPVSGPKQISEHTDPSKKPAKINLPAGTVKLACIDMLDKIANELESKGRIQEAYEIDKISDKLDKEANIAGTIKNIISKIPGFSKLPTKEEALAYLKPLLLKDKSKIKSIIEQVSNIVSSAQAAPKASPAGRDITAINIGSIAQNLKLLANPKTIIAILALMAAFNTTNAAEIVSYDYETGEDTVMLTGENARQEVKQVIHDYIGESFNKYKDTTGIDKTIPPLRIEIKLSGGKSRVLKINNEYEKRMGQMLKGYVEKLVSFYEGKVLTGPEANEYIQKALNDFYTHQEGRSI